MSQTAMFPLESPVINISLLGSVARAKAVLSSSSAARYLPINEIQNNHGLTMRVLTSDPCTRKFSITMTEYSKAFAILLEIKVLKEIGPAHDEQIFSN